MPKLQIFVYQYLQHLVGWAPVLPSASFHVLTGCLASWTIGDRKSGVGTGWLGEARGGPTSGGNVPAKNFRFLESPFFGVKEVFVYFDKTLAASAIFFVYAFKQKNRKDLILGSLSTHKTFD
jgi:hypothetical protein